MVDHEYEEESVRKRGEENVRGHGVENVHERGVENVREREVENDPERGVERVLESDNSRDRACGVAKGLGDGRNGRVCVPNRVRDVGRNPWG
jgi:hypothetical protein